MPSPYTPSANEVIISDLPSFFSGGQNWAGVTVVIPITAADGSPLDPSQFYVKSANDGSAIKVDLQTAEQLYAASIAINDLNSNFGKLDAQDIPSQIWAPIITNAQTVLTEETTANFLADVLPQIPDLLASEIDPLTIAGAAQTLLSAASSFGKNNAELALADSVLNNASSLLAKSYAIYQKDIFDSMAHPALGLTSGAFDQPIDFNIIEKTVLNTFLSLNAGTAANDAISDAADFSASAWDTLKAFLSEFGTAALEALLGKLVPNIGNLEGTVHTAFGLGQDTLDVASFETSLQGLIAAAQTSALSATPFSSAALANDGTKLANSLAVTQGQVLGATTGSHTPPPTFVIVSSPTVSENSKELVFTIVELGTSAQPVTLYLSTLQNWNSSGVYNTSVVGSHISTDYYYEGLNNQAITFGGGSPTGSTYSQSIAINSVGLTSGSETFGFEIQEQNLSGQLVTVGSTSFTIVNQPSGATGPTVSSITSFSSNGNVLNAGQTVTFDVTFSSAVTVTTTGGLPVLTLNDGEIATYKGGSGVNVLTFTYAVKSGDRTSDLQVTSLTVPSGSKIADLAGNLAVTTGVTENSGLQINTSAPTVTITTTGGLTASAAQTISGTVDVADAGSTVTVFDGANNVGSTIVAGDGSWTAHVTLSVQGQNTLVAKDTNSGGTGVSNSVFYTLDTASYSLTPSNPTATENQGSLVFTLTRSNETNAANVFVQTDDTHNSSNPSNKYFNEQNLIPVSFAQYATSATFSIPINDIHATSGTQTFGVSIYQLASTAGPALAATTFTINDTDTNTGPLTGNIITNDTVTGTTMISSPVNIFNGATLQNNGVIDINSGGSIGGDNAGGILFNPAGSVINIDTADNPSNTIDVTRVNNGGTIMVSPGSGNVATIWTTNGGISDSGAIQVLSGTLQLHMFGAASTASLNASGISVASSADLLFTGAGTFTISGGSYSVAGTTTVGNSTYAANVVFTAGTVVNVGSNWSIQDGSVDFSAATLSGTFSSLTLGPDAFSLNLGANSVAIDNFSSYLINVTDSGTITLTGSDITDATWLGGGTIINEGSISAPAGWQDGEITSGETFINHGVVNNLLFDSFSFVTNGSDGVMNLQSGEAHGGTITNDGLIHFYGTGSGNGQINGLFFNAGTVEFSSASGWSLNGGGASNAAGFIVDTGVTLFFGGNAATDSYTINGGTFDGGGNLWVVSGAQVKFLSTHVDLPFHNDGTIEIASGTLTLEQALTGTGSVTMDAGTTLALDAPQGFTNSISGFSSGDTIDLIGVAATGVSINSSNQLVVTDAGTTVATLRMIGSYPGAGLQFLLNSDGIGGTNVTLGVPSAPVVSAGAVTSYADSPSPTPVVLDGNLSLIGGGNPTLAGATVSISVGFQTGDVLAATTAGTGITASYNSLSGTLTLSGSDTPANYQSVLESVTFDSGINAQQNGADPSRTIAWIASDGTRTSMVADSTVIITDAAPTVTALATSSFTAGATSSPVILDATLAVSDIDNTTFTGAAISIASGFSSGDTLGVTTAGTAITVASNTGGILQLTGTDTLADYQAVLRTVTFSTTDTMEGSRIIVWTANDGSRTSTLATSSVDISAGSTNIESLGSTSLVQVGNNYFLDSHSTGTGPELQYGGAPVVAGEFAGATPIAVEATATGYEVAWNAGAGQYSVWNTNSTGNYVSHALFATAGNSVALEALEPSFHQDLNGDGVIGINLPTTVIESLGSTKLVEVGNNYYLDSISTGTGPELQYGGTAVVAGEFGSSTPIAVEATATGYEVAWNAGGGQYSAWNTDSNGNYVSHALFATSGTSVALESLEPGFHQDLNGDGVIGINVPTTVIESFGATKLVEVGNNYYLDNISTGTGPELQYGGTAVVAGEFGSSTPIAVEATATGYEVAWNVGGGQYSAWNTDSHGNYTSHALYATPGSSVALEALETSFHQDLNGDGVIGSNLPTTVIESFGATKLVEVGSNYYLDNISTGTGPELQYSGAPVAAGEFGSSTPVGAEATATGYEVAWNVGGGQYSVWNTDSSGNYSSHALFATPGTSVAVEALEPGFHQDLNGDGIIGINLATASAIESFGSTSLIGAGNNYYLLNNGSGTGPELQYGGAPVVAGEFAGATPIAAEATATGYQVAWNAGGGQYSVWNTDSSGNYVSHALFATPGTSVAVQALEPSFQQDLNGDGVIGVPAAHATSNLQAASVGGGGSDTFVFQPGLGATVIPDLSGTATIELDGFSSFTNNAQLTTLSEAYNDSITLTGVTATTADVTISPAVVTISPADVTISELHASGFIIH